MLRNLNKIIDYTLQATDGDIGKCDDFLFEDRPWIVRYMVANTGRWLFGRKVLLPLKSLEKPNWIARVFHINLTKKQIEKSPPLRKDEPVSRKYEKESFLYYGWPAYWDSSSEDNRGSRESQGTESFLRSIKEITGYSVRNADDRIGKVMDFIADDETWAIRYIVVESRETLRNKQVLVAPQWVHSIDWLSHSIHFELTEDFVKSCPEFNPEEPVNREYETRLYDYYGRPYYWQTDEANL